MRPICLCSTRQKKTHYLLGRKKHFSLCFVVGASLRIRFCLFDVIAVCSIVRFCFVYILRFPMPRCASDVDGLLWTTTTTTNDGVGGRMQATMYLPPATRQHSRCTCVSSGSFYMQRKAHRKRASILRKESAKGWKSSSWGECTHTLTINWILQWKIYHVRTCAALLIQWTCGCACARRMLAEYKYCVHSSCGVGK